MNASQNPKDYSLEPFFDSSPDLMCVAGFDGYFKRINPALCELLKYPEEELYAQPINSFVHPDDQELTHEHRKQIHGGRSLLNFENRYITKDGEIVWLSWSSIPYEKSGLVYAIAKNITYQKEHEGSRNAMLADLTKTNERLKQLNYATSHDLRSPVANLISLFGILDHSKITDPETQSFLSMLTDAADELEQMLNRYLEQIQQTDALSADMELVPLFEVIRAVQKPLSYLIRDARAVFDLEFSVYDRIPFKRSYLEGIFLNLITNSIKYAHPERYPEIRIETRVVDGRKQIIYSDNGIGFDSEANKDRVFGLHEKFHEHKDSKGIGLYLVACHMQEMGGRIEVDSKVGEGTTFTLTFAD